MRFGLSVPPFTDPAEVVRPGARRAEASGWDGFFLWDHLRWDGVVEVHDPWVLLGAIAQETERMRLGTMVTPLSRRRPQVVAKHLTTLDHLSGGRAVLGVGLGDPPDLDFSDFGDEPSYRVRAAITDEALDGARRAARRGPGRPPRRTPRRRRRRCAPCRCSARGSRSGWPAGRPTPGRWRARKRWDGYIPIADDLPVSRRRWRRTSARTRTTDWDLVAQWAPGIHRRGVRGRRRHLADAVGLAEGGGLARRAARAGGVRPRLDHRVGGTQVS